MSSSKREQFHFTTPNNANATRNRLQSSLAAVKRDSLAAELEKDPNLSPAKRHARSQIFNSSLSHASLERQLLAAQTAKMELEAKLREREVAIEQLERDRRWFAEREEKEREERESERGEWEEERTKSHQTLTSLRTSLTIAHAELADLKDAHSSLSRSTTHQIASQKTQISTLRHSVDALEKLASERGEAIARLQAELDAERKCAAKHDKEEVLAEGGEGTAEGENKGKDAEIIASALHSQVEHLRKVEAVNAKLQADVTALRSRREKVEVLKEEKRALEGRVRLLEGLVREGEKEKEMLRESSSSTPTKPNHPSSPPPIPTTLTLTTLQNKYTTLLSEHGDTLASLRSTEAQLADTRARLDEVARRAEELEGETEELRRCVGRREGELRVSEEELRFLRELVASYNAEEAHFAQQQQQQQQASSSTVPASFDTLKTQHIAHLEAQLDEYKKTSERLAREVEALGGRMKGKTREELINEVEERSREVEQLKSALESANESVKSHEEQIDKLEQTLFELSGEMAGGRHVPSNVRVLSLVDNPEQRWFDSRKEVVMELRGENEALLKRVGELEKRVGGVSREEDVGGGGEGEEGAGAGVVPRESFELVRKEKTQLEEEMKQKEKRLLRLQQVFTSKSAEFREAIASILGVKLAFYPNGQVRVTSLYDLCASFVFKPASSTSDGMKMQLVAQGEGGPQDLPNMMHYWIENERCIPGFMASVTLECYDKAKREGEIGGGGGGGSSEG